VKRIVAIVLGVVIVLGVGGFAVYWFILKSDPEPRAKIEKTHVVDGQQGLDGKYAVAPGGKSFVGYRVQENLLGVDQTATGRTSDVQGSLTIAGTTIDPVEIVANLKTLKSDEDRRDNAIRNDGLETDRFPEGKFALTKPIALDAVPEAGKTVKVTAQGDFTLHGVTKAVEIPLEGRWDGKQVQVVGSLPISFGDYDMEAPSRAGFVSVEDRGEMEFQIFFTPA
jgi:polyisoprenoid-binding protein YceI